VSNLDIHAGRTIENIGPVFKPSSWRTRIDFINHLILNNNILISILAEQGGGKTAFSNLLQVNLDTNISSCVLTASALFERESFVAQIASKLNYHGEMAISKFIAQSKAHKRHALVIIDDAHHLPAAFIEEILSALQQQGSSGYFHVCLVSDHSLVALLNNLALNRKDMIHSIELNPLSESETKAYLIDCMSRVPGVEKIVTDERIKKFHHLTGGKIAAINKQMAAFISGNARGSRRADKPYKRLSVVASAVMAAVAVAYLWQPETFQLVPSTELVRQVPKPLLTARNEVSTQDLPNLKSEIPGWQVESVKQALEAMPLRRSELVAINDEDNTLHEDLVVMDKVVVIPKIVQRQVSQEVISGKKSIHVASYKSVKKAVNSELSHAALKPNNNYTIQLLASHNRAEIERFTQKNHIKGKIKILRTERGGLDWYILAFGEYTQRDLARQAAHHLPSALRKFKPWVRPMSELQLLG